MAVLLSVEGLLIVVLCAAFLTACLARIPSRWLRICLAVLFCWFPAGVATLVLVFAWKYCVSELSRYWNYLPAPTMLLGTCVVGVYLGLIVLPVVGLWKNAESPHVARAKRWSLTKLSFALPGSLFVLITTILLFDVRVRGEMADVQNRSQKVFTKFKSVTVPDDANAASSLIEAYKSLGISNSRPLWWGDVGRPEFDVTRAEIAEFLQSHGTSLDLALRASRLPAAQFAWSEDEVLSHSDQAQLEGVGNLRELLMLAAQYHALNGDFPKCMEYLDAMQRLSQLEIVPATMMWGLVAQTFELGRGRVLETILNQAKLRPTDFHLPVKPDAYTCRTSLRMSLDLEEATLLDVHVRMHAGKLPPDPYIFDVEQRSVIERAGAVWQASLIVPRVFRVADDLQVFPVFIRECQSMLAQPSYKADTFEWDSRFRLYPGSSFTLRQGHILIAQVQLANMIDAKSALSDIAIGVAAFYARIGRYPEKLDELIPDFIERLPIDPLEGEPFKISLVEGGAVLYGGNWREEFGQYDPFFCLGAAFSKYRIKPREEF